MPISLLASLLAPLRFRAKFAVVLLLVMTGLGILSALLVLDRNHTVAVLEQKSLGLVAWKPIIETVKFQQRSRGLSNAWLNGDDSARAKMQAAMKEATARLTEVEAATRGLPQVAPVLQQWRAAWDKVQQEGGAPSANLIRLHSEAINQGLATLQDISNASALAFEPAPDSYYLQGVLYEDIPQAIELYGQFRALGAGINTAREITPAQHDRLVVLESRINYQLQRLRRQLELLAREAQPGLKGTVEDYQQRVEARRQKVMALIQDLRQGHYSDPQAFFEEMTKVIDGAYAFSEEKLFGELAANVAQRKAAAEQQRLLTVGAASLLLLLILLLFGAIIQNVTQQVESVRRAAEALAEGDLTQAPQSRGADELSEAVRSLATGINKLRDIFGDFARAISAIDSQTATLASASTQVASASEHQATTVAQLAATVEEMSAGVQHIADSSQAACHNADSTQQLASQGGTMARQTVDGIGAIASHVEESASIVQRLGNESAKISTIVGTIKEIADQTNLLALNAAIEAARAGESGRGFAVVADEVRKLAERTSGATVEISTNIGKIQGDISAAVGAMELSVNNVQEGVTVAEQAGQAMSHIHQQAEDVRHMVSDINHALQEQTTATQVVAQSVEALAQVSEENHSAAESVRATTEQLRLQAEQLGQRMRAFRV